MTILPCICNCVPGFVSSPIQAFKLQMLCHSLLQVLLGAPQYEGYENMLPQQFRDNAPQQQEVVIE